MGACPTVKMTGPSGQVIVNSRDAAHYESRGYKLVGPHSGGGEAITIREPEPDPDAEDLSSLKKTELQERCEAAGLETSGTKDALIARLEGAEE